MKWRDYLWAPVAALMMIAAPSASAQTFTSFYSNVRLNGVALDSAAGFTNPLFNIPLGGTLTLSLDVDPGNTDFDFLLIALSPSTRATPLSNFITVDASGPVYQPFVFNLLVQANATIAIDLGLSSTDYQPLSGGGPINGQSFPFRVNVSVAAVPGPVAGAGLLPLLGLAGAWYARRRKRAA